MGDKQDMEALLWANGCPLETAQFVARMLSQNGYALVKTEYLESIGTPFASIHTHDEACERLRRINSSTYSGSPSKQVLPERPSREAAMNRLTVPAREGIEAQRGHNDIFPGDPYPVAHELKRGLDALRARASRGGITSAEVFALTDPLMDILARAALAQEGGRDGE